MTLILACPPAGEPVRHLRPVPSTGPRHLHGTDLPAVPSGLFFAEFDPDDPREYVVDFDAAAIYIRAELSPLAARRVWAAALTEYVMRAPCWVADIADGVSAGW